MQTLSFSHGSPVHVGDRLRIAGLPNSHRTILIGKQGSMLDEIKTFVRPSRGYARHVRRMKALRTSR